MLMIHTFKNVRRQKIHWTDLSVREESIENKFQSTSPIVGRKSLIHPHFEFLFLAHHHFSLNSGKNHPFLFAAPFSVDITADFQVECCNQTFNSKI